MPNSTNYFPTGGGDVPDESSVPDFGYFLLIGGALVVTAILVFGVLGKDGLEYIKACFGGTSSRRQATVEPAFASSVLDALWQRMDVVRYGELVQPPPATDATLPSASDGSANNPPPLRPSPSSSTSHTEACAICFVPYTPEDECAVLRETCKHFFHRECLERWLKEGKGRTSVCIICQTPLAPDLLGGEVGPSAEQP